MKNYFKTGLLLVVTTFVSCNQSSTKTTTENDSVNVNDNIANEGNKKWVSLFDGKSLAGWHGFNKTGEVKNWKIEDSALVCLGAAKDASGGDIVSDNEYENFELSWEWKITTGGNSGVMYHVVESAQYKAPYETGPEYQVIDDIGFPEKLEESQKGAADYGMYAPNEKKKLNPVGEWNTSRIVFDHGKVEHWINGEKVIEFIAWSDEWTKKKNEGKWKDYPGYGNAKKGKIALQDHGNKVYYRKIMVREL